MGIPNPVRTLPDALDMPLFIPSPALVADSLREANILDILELVEAEGGCSEADAAEEEASSVVSWSALSRRV